MTSIFLTGITGFVGRAVAARIDDAGHECRALVRGARPELRLPPGARARVVPGDLERIDEVASRLGGVDSVIHLAACVDPASQADEARMARTNLEATLALARCARDAGARRFVFASSIAAMGFWSGPATPASPCVPVSTYGHLKLAAEERLARLQRTGFEVVVLRAPTVYGPGERYNFLAWTRAVERGVFRVIGDGKNRFPLCSSDNFASALVAAAEGRVAAGVHLVGDRETYTVNRIHAAIARALGRRVPGLRLPVTVAYVAGAANEVVSRVLPRVPSVLSRARVRTLSVDQRWDVSSLQRAGVELAADLEAEVARTIAEYRARGLVGALTAPVARQ